MKSRSIRTIAAVVLVLAMLGVAGCSDDEPQGKTEPAVTVAALSGDAWQPLLEYRKKYLVGPRNTGQVKFRADGRWSGFDGCNRESGTFTLNDSTVTMTGGPVTDMKCANFSPYDVLNGMQLRVDESGGQLTAEDPEGEIVVEYTR